MPLSLPTQGVVRWGGLINRVLRSLESQTFYAASYGAKGDGVADDTQAISRAVQEATEAGGGRVVLGRVHRISGTVNVTRGVTIEGGGSRATRIVPDASFTDWVFTVDAPRNGEWQIGDTTYDPANDMSGPILRGFFIDGQDRADAHKGIYIKRADDLLMDDVTFGFINGTALAVGSDPSEASVGGVRESEFHRVKVYQCGAAGGTPATAIQNASNGTGDGTNQLVFDGCRFVYNHGGTVIRNHHASATLRRITLANCMFHGLSHPSVGELADHDIILMEGRIISVDFAGTTRMNGSGTAPLALIRCQVSAINSANPQGVTFDNLEATETVGDVFAWDKLSDLKMYGRMSYGSIDGAIIRVNATTPAVIGFDVRLTGGTAFDGTAGTGTGSKFVIPATHHSKGTITWNGSTVTPETA